MAKEQSRTQLLLPQLGYMQSQVDGKLSLITTDHQHDQSHMDIMFTNWEMLGLCLLLETDVWVPQTQNPQRYPGLCEGSIPIKGQAG